MKYDNLSYLWNAKTERQRGERGVRPQPFGLMSKWSIGFILLSKTVGLYLPTIQWYSISLFSMHTLFTYIYIFMKCSIVFDVGITPSLLPLPQTHSQLRRDLHFIWMDLMNFELSSIESTDQRNYICSNIWCGKWSVKVKISEFTHWMCFVHSLFVAQHSSEMSFVLASTRIFN